MGSARGPGYLSVRHTSDISRSIDRIGRLISDLLDSTRLNEGLFSLSLRRTELVGLTREVAETLAPMRDHVKLVANPEQVLAVVDAERLRQAIENLLSNALKFSPDNVPVTVHVTQEQRGDCTWALITVADRGPDITREVQARLFERFATGSGSKQGLYLARAIVEAHAGILTVDSNIGKGARFTIAVSFRSVHLRWHLKSPFRHADKSWHSYGPTTAGGAVRASCNVCLAYHAAAKANAAANTTAPGICTHQPVASAEAASSAFAAAATSSTPARTGPMRIAAQTNRIRATASSLAPAYSAKTEALATTTGVGWPTAVRKVPGAMRLNTPATALNNAPTITTAPARVLATRWRPRELG